MESARSVNEARRLEVLHAHRVLDSSPEEAFDNLTRLASEICSTPIALISLVDEARQWFKARVGLALSETPRELAFCAHALETPDTVIVVDALADARFSRNALVTHEPNIRFYAGVPLVSAEGCVLGTLCVIDRVPRSLSGRELTALRRVARQVEVELELRRGLMELRELAGAPSSRRIESPPASSTDERQQARIAELERMQHEKDQLLALAVHDLKSPLMSVLVNAGLLGEMALPDARAREMVADVEVSAAAMQRLVLDLLDVAKSKYRGLAPRAADFLVEPLLLEVARGLRARAALGGQSLIVTPVAERLALRADRDYLRRVLENLIDNSLRYSGEGTEVIVSARELPASLELSVCDTGPGIPERDRARIFDPFTRLELGEAAPRSGHGLGLAFCKLAVEAQRGRIWAESNQPRGVRFCVELPIRG